MFSIFIGLILAFIITAYFIGGNPIFMFIFFIVIVIVVSISAIFSNTWEDITTMSIFGTTLSNFPITAHIITNLPYYMAIIGFIGIVMMFIRPFTDGG